MYSVSKIMTEIFCILFFCTVFEIQCMFILMKHLNFCLGISNLIANDYHIGQGRLKLYFYMTIRNKLAHIPSATPLKISGLHLFSDSIFTNGGKVSSALIIL